MENIVTLQDLITAVVFGLLAPTLATQIVEWLRGKQPSWTFFGTWLASVVIAVGVAWAGWIIGLIMYYFPAPAETLAGWRAWVEAAFAIAWPVGLIAAGYHAYKKGQALPDNGRKLMPGESNVPVNTDP